MKTEISAPPARLLTPVPIDVQRALVASIAESSPPETIFEWLEKVRRFGSYAGRNLASVARQRFGRESDAQLSWMTRFLVEGATRHPGKGAVPYDPACVNGALYCLDAMYQRSAELEATVRAAEQEIRAALLASAWADAPPALGRSFEADLGHWRGEAAKCGPLVLLSPNPYSLLSIAVLELCLRLELPVAAILLRKFSARRAVEEWKRDGLRLPRKIWRKLVLRSDENATAEGLSFKSLVRALSPQYSDIRRTASVHDIPLVSLDRFQGCGEALRPFRAELALFTGGGLIDEETLASFPRGIINVHMGLLPQYKGMDVVEAPLLEGRRLVGSAAHLMVRKLDAGPVLQKLEVDSQSYSSLGALRNSIGCFSPLLMVDSALGLFSGRILPVQQPPSGRQYFIVHRRLKAIIDEVLKVRGAKSDPGPRSLETCFAEGLRMLEPAR